MCRNSVICLICPCVPKFLHMHVYLYAEVPLYARFFFAYTETLLCSLYFPMCRILVPDAAFPWVTNLRHACPIFVYAEFLPYSPSPRMIWILSHIPNFHVSRNFVIRIPNNLHIVFRLDLRDLLCEVMLPLFRYKCR